MQSGRLDHDGPATPVKLCLEAWVLSFRRKLRRVIVRGLNHPIDGKETSASQLADLASDLQEELRKHRRPERCGELV